MFRLLILLAAVALAGFGLMWLGDNPGVVTLTLRGVEYKVSLMVAFGVVAAVAIAWSIAWGLLRVALRLPSLVALAARGRRRERGLAAVSRGFVAIQIGDSRAAAKHAAEAKRLIANEPMAKLLTAQAAQLTGDRAGAVAAYHAMLEHQETQGLALRGLHLEAKREGHHEAALQYAMQANAQAPAAWSGQAVLEDRTRRGDWAGALETIETNAAAHLIDKATARRWSAVVKTAMAEELKDRDPKGAMALAQQACKLSPGLVPAAALYGRLAAVSGDTRRASKSIETAYAQTPHPDLAAAYVRLRHGDSIADRLTRAQALARLAPNDPESMLTVGRAALEAHDIEAARKAVAALVESDSRFGRPTRRVCTLMADIEQTDGGQGAVREWLWRAARAPSDKAWVGDGVISDHWLPVSPSGTLDAFVWRTPDERLAPPGEPAPIEPEPEAAPPAPALTAPPASDAAPAQEPEAPARPRGEEAGPAPAQAAVLVEPAAPDDPGPGGPPPRRRWLFAGD